MADAEAAARESVKKSTEAKAKSVEEATKRMLGTPTPTQEECDLAAAGVPVPTHADDGSGPEPVLTRVVEAKPAQSSTGYQTRHTRAAPSSS